LKTAFWMLVKLPQSLVIGLVASAGVVVH